MAFSLGTGSVPGCPRQMGHTFVFGGAPNWLGQLQNILLAVASSTWHSRPMTVSNSSPIPTETIAAAGSCRRKGQRPADIRPIAWAGMRLLRRPVPADGSSRAATPRGHASPTHIWLALSAVYVIWGSTYLAIRLAVRTIPPFLSASIRFVIAGAVLYLWSIRRGDTEHDRPGWRQWRAAALVGGGLLLGGKGSGSWSEARRHPGGVAPGVAPVPRWPGPPPPVTLPAQL